MLQINIYRQHRAFVRISMVLVLLVGMVVLPAATTEATAPIEGNTFEFNTTATNVGSNSASVRSVAVGDLDGDGDLDIVTASDDNTVKVWQNDGTPFDAGNWASQTVGGHYDYVRSVAVGDLDGDGVLDIVTASDDYTVKVWQNDGTPFDAGNWASQTAGNHADYVYSVAVGDLDGDGDLDIVSGGNDSKVNAWQNDGTPFDAGNWASQTVGSHTDNVYSVAVGDLDGDGDLDIISGGYDYDVKVWQNDGTPFDAGNWASQTAGNHSTYVLSVAAGDLDGDGDLDIVSGGADNKVRIWQNDGTPFDAGNWASQTAGSHSSTVLSVAAGDLDGDGDLDIVSGGIDTNVNIWQNDGAPFDAGNWAAQIAGSHSSYVFSVAVGDLDGDGDLDIVSGGNDNKVNAWRNDQIHRNAPFNSTATNLGSHSNTVNSVAMGDLDGDGDLDIVSGGNDHNVNVWQNNGAPFGAGNWASQTAGSHSTWVTTVAVGDLDGDGDLDIVSGGYNFDVKVWQNDGTPFDAGNWASQTVGSHENLVFSVAVGDVDGDGDLDIVSGGEDNIVRVWRNDGTPFDAGDWTSRFVGGYSSTVYSVAVGDLDKDGDLDIVSGGDVNVTIWQNDGALFGAPILASQTADTEAWASQTVGGHYDRVRSVAVGDLDGDGDLDIVSSGNDGFVNIWQNDGTPFDAGNWAARTAGTVPNYMNSVAVGDLDGDGDLDIISGDEYLNDVSVWQNDGIPFDASNWASQTVGSHSNTVNSVAIGDLDGDGDLDIVSGGADSKVNAWQNQGGSAGVEVTVTAPGSRIQPGAEDDIFKVVVTHNGISGDRDLELVRWDLDIFSDGSSCSVALDTTTANNLLDKVRVRLDDGDGVFESDGSDVQVAEIDTFDLTNGVQPIPFTNDEPNVQVGATNSKTYWVSLLTNSPQGDLCFQLDPDADMVIEGKSPNYELSIQASRILDFAVSIRDSSPTKTNAGVPTAITLVGFQAEGAAQTLPVAGMALLGLLFLAATMILRNRTRSESMHQTERTTTDQPVQSPATPSAFGASKPYTPPAILHELALETRAGSAFGVDPVMEEILGIPTK